MNFTVRATDNQKNGQAPPTITPPPDASRNHTLMKRKKTKLLLSSPNHTADLLSIIELPNGDLQVSLKNPRQIGEVTNPTDEIKQLKYSIHCSDRSPRSIRTFKRTATHLDDTNETSVATWPHLGPNESAWVFSHRFSNLGSPTYATSHSKSDQTFSIDCSDVSKYGLVIAVFIQEHQPSRETMTADPRFHSKSFQFGRFYLALYWTFHAAHPHHQGFHLCPASLNSPMINHTSGENQTPAIESIVGTNISRHLWATTGTCTATFLDQLETIYPNLGNDIGQYQLGFMHALAHIYTPHPELTLQDPNRFPGN